MDEKTERAKLEAATKYNRADRDEQMKADGVFYHASPRVDLCDHDFRGWRDFEDGNGGELVCTKCGMGAMHYSMMVSP
jgi:hypothetical protein